MINSLDKINPRFRQLTDLFLFSDRKDLNLTEFHKLLHSNYSDHFNYLLEKFRKSTDIFWEEGADFWYSRLSFLLALNDKLITKNIEAHLEKRVVQLIRFKYEISVDYDIEYMQYLQFCRVKFARNENLNFIKNFLIDLPPHVKFEKLICLVKTFIPIVFKDLEDYAQHIIRKITQSSNHFLVLLALEQYGVVIDKKPIIDLALQIIVDRSSSEKNRRTLFTILSDKSLLNLLQDRYKKEYKSQLLGLINECDYREIEEHHLKNIKNLIELDSSIADELAVIYADKLFSRNTGHKRANADRLIRLINQVPQISSKKILAHLSCRNKMSDIKHILSAFPDLKKLAAFV